MSDRIKVVYPNGYTTDHGAKLAERLIKQGKCKKVIESTTSNSTTATKAVPGAK
jgi:hypothetical protein